MKPHSMAVIGWVPALAAVLLCSAIAAAWTARGGEEPAREPTDVLPAPRPPPLCVAAGCAPVCCLMHLEELLGSQGGTHPLPGTGWCARAWEAGRGRGVPFTRAGTFLCHKTESTYGLYALRAVISGTGSHYLTSPGNHISRYCTDYINHSQTWKILQKIYHLAYEVLPKRRHKDNTYKLERQNLFSRPLFFSHPGQCGELFASLGNCTEAGTLPSHSPNAGFHFLELHNSICSGGSKGQWGRAPVERRASSSH